MTRSRERKREIERECETEQVIRGRRFYAPVFWQTKEMVSQIEINDFI